MEYFLKKPIVKALITIALYSVAAGLSIRLNKFK